MNLTLQCRISRGSAVIDADVELNQRVVGLFGPSGAGKTTLLHALAGLLRPQEGRIVLDGRVLFDSTTGIDVPTHERRVGIVFQDIRLFPHLCVRDNLLFGYRRLPRDRRRLELHQVADTLNIGPLLDRRSQELSGGERQRVALGRTLLASPDLLLLDEPLVGLDPHLRMQVLPFLKRIRDELQTPMVYVAHDISEILTLTDYVTYIDRGTLKVAGRYHDLLLSDRSDTTVLQTSIRNVFDMRIAEHMDDRGCSRICHVADAASDARSEQGPAPLTLTVPRLAGEVATRVTAVIRAVDIAIAAHQVEHISVQNQFVGTISRHRSVGHKIILEVGAGAPLLVEITRSAFDRLHLQRGKKVYCLIKANAIEVHETGAQS